MAVSESLIAASRDLIRMRLVLRFSIRDSKLRIIFSAPGNPALSNPMISFDNGSTELHDMAAADSNCWHFCRRISLELISVNPELSAETILSVMEDGSRIVLIALIYSQFPSSSDDTGSTVRCKVKVFLCLDQGALWL